VCPFDVTMQGFREIEIDHSYWSECSVKVENVEIWRCPNSKALEYDIGQPDIADSLIRALLIMVPRHNNENFATSLSYFLKSTNLGHRLANNKCFITLKSVRSHNARPTDKGKLIKNENYLDVYEFGASCTLKVRGGYGAGEPGGLPIGQYTEGLIVRYLEFIFDTSIRCY
jgi:hypothetical protein